MTFNLCGIPLEDGVKPCFSHTLKSICRIVIDRRHLMCCASAIAVVALTSGHAVSFHF